MVTNKVDKNDNYIWKLMLVIYILFFLKKTMLDLQIFRITLGWSGPTGPSGVREPDRWAGRVGGRSRRREGKKGPDGATKAQTQRSLEKERAVMAAEAAMRPGRCGWTRRTSWPGAALRRRRRRRRREDCEGEAGVHRRAACAPPDQALPLHPRRAHPASRSQATGEDASPPGQYSCPHQEGARRARRRTSSSSTASKGTYAEMEVEDVDEEGGVTTEN